jgi:CubicO group peptidase (beta-lactamase class C family)
MFAHTATALSIFGVLATALGIMSLHSPPARATESPGGGDVLWPTKAWPLSTPEEQGMDSAALARLIEKIGGYRQDSFLVVRHGRIVAEATYAPYVAGISHDLRSVTKSVMSTLTAIQLRNGDLDSVEHPVMDLFSERQIENVDARKSAMTVQTLLDMTSGIAWSETALTPDETIWRLYQSSDRVGFVLNQPMAEAPGKTFNYDSGNPYLLSALINKKSARNAFDFAKTELFEPLGITSAAWATDAQGVTDGSAQLFLSPHDMARFGYLYLHDGRWEGRQIIPSSWVERAKQGPIPALSGLHYANLWWSLPEKGAYFALGRHSQKIVVIPKFDLVAVMTGYLRDDEVYSVVGLVDDISGAVKSDQPLRADPIATALLTNAIAKAASEKPTVVGGTPELAKAISGKVYRFADGVLHVKSLALNFLDAGSSWEIATYPEEPGGAGARLSGPIGLDGFYRMTPPTPHGINAVKGRWIGERTFAAERRVLGHGEVQTWTLTFDANQVTLNFETTDGVKAEVHGEASE